MAYLSYDIKPNKVKKIKTKYREIKTAIPNPKSVQVLKDLRKYEPRAMGGQPPIVWHKARNFNVWDEYGNKWIDFSSGVLVANVGHLREEVKQEMLKQIKQGLIHNYCFPNVQRARLVKKLVSMAPKGIEKAFLLTTGSEAVECAIKLARTYGQMIGGKKKIGILGFNSAFHGRTLGSQMAGGIPGLKTWIVNVDKSFYQIPYPDGYFNKNTGFENFKKELKKRKIKPNMIAGFMMESYQGGIAAFADKEYIRGVRAWCKKNKIIFIDDEVQAGFGRTGKLFSIEHYGITPDIICCGKGLSGGLPISAVLGPSKIMDIYGPGEMTSTHSGNPLVSRTAVKSLELIQKEKLVARSARLGMILHGELNKLKDQYSDIIGVVNGKGLLVGVLFRKAGTENEPDGNIAFKIVKKCIEKGLMLYAPLGAGGATIKMNPPLIIEEAALREGISIFKEALEEAVNESK